MFLYSLNERITYVYLLMSELWQFCLTCSSVRNTLVAYFVQTVAHLIKLTRSSIIHCLKNETALQNSDGNILNSGLVQKLRF